MRYHDLSLTVRETTWEEVFQSAQRIQEFFLAVQSRFVERDDLIKTLKYAFMLREHLLVDGPTGTGKSAVLNTVIDHIQDASVWSMDLTRFTTDTMVFGAYDIKKMREEGQTVHLTEGSLIEANFAKGGEFLDANDPLLRTLLGVMNERKVRRGPNEYHVPLVSFVADTNFRIEEFPNRRQQLAAVLDRFLFQVTVDYVKDPRNRYLMLEMALEQMNRQPLPKLHIDDVVRVSGVIIDNDLVTDRYVREAYQEMTLNFSLAREKEGRAPLSDRRYVKGAHVMEVGAILHGRSVCTFDDLQHTRYVLIQHKDDIPLLEKAKAEAIEKWAAKSQRREIDIEGSHLKEILISIPNPDIAALSYVELQKLLEDLNGALTKLNDFKPQSIEVRSEHTKAFTNIQDVFARIDVAMISKLMEKVPVLTEEIDPALLTPLMRTAQQIEWELRAIKPKSDKARSDLAKSLEQVGLIIAKLQVEFMGKK